MKQYIRVSLYVIALFVGAMAFASLLACYCWLISYGRVTDELIESIFKTAKIVAGIAVFFLVVVNWCVYFKNKQHKT